MCHCFPTDAAAADAEDDRSDDDWGTDCYDVAAAVVVVMQGGTKWRKDRMERNADAEVDAADAAFPGAWMDPWMCCENMSEDTHDDDRMTLSDTGSCFLLLLLLLTPDADRSQKKKMMDGHDVAAAAADADASSSRIHADPD